MEIKDYLGGGRKGQGWHQYFVPLLETNCIQGEVQRGSAGVDCDRVTSTYELGKMLLEFLNFRASGQPAGTQSLFHRTNLCVVNVWYMKR
jgi:hypothetical protein